MARVKSFSEYVVLLAQESPAACILDWGRRLELAGREYFERTAGSPPRRWVDVEGLLRLDSDFGPLGAALHYELRRTRNLVAHNPSCPTPEAAIEFARHAFRLQSCLTFDGPFLTAPLLPVRRPPT